MPITKEASMLGSMVRGKQLQEWRKNNIIEYNKTPKKCKLCDISIEYDKRVNNFCSHSCSASYNNKRLPERFCKLCKNILDRDQKNYCNIQHYTEYTHKKNVGLIILGKINNPRILRDYLIEKYGRYCFICKRKTWRGKEVPLDLDHIDGDYTNNFPKNLRLLCLNCHGQTPTYKAGNKGNGKRPIKHRKRR